MADAADAASAESIAGFVFEGTVQYAPALSAGAFLPLNCAPQLPRGTRFARPGDRRAAKHRKLRSLPAKVARRFRHYSAEDRCALAIQRTKERAAMDHSCWPTAAFVLPPSAPVRKNPNYCALMLIKVFASSVSFLSVAPSSSSVCCKSLAP